MSNIKEEFTEKFLVEENGKVVFDWSLDFIQRIGAWLDTRAKMEDEATDRIITLEEENDKLLNAKIILEEKVRELEGVK